MLVLDHEEVEMRVVGAVDDSIDERCRGDVASVHGQGRVGGEAREGGDVELSCAHGCSR